MILQFNEIDKHKDNNLIKGYEDDFGYDVRAGESGVVYPGCSSGFIYTGLHVHLPHILGARFATRSNQIGANIMTDGTIDSGYHGSIKLKLHNLDNAKAYEWEKGDRIAQLIFYIRPEGFINAILRHGCGGSDWFSITEKDISEWPKTERARNGFGSTGVK